eukprot:2984139-Rhodomonas_salina.1
MRLMVADVGCGAPVHESGDKWLELKVLRGLERGYLIAPNQSRVARASLSIKETRMREHESAVAGALSTENHAALASLQMGAD